MYADIIVDITHEKLDKIFQYRIPKEMEGRLQTGMEVLIPFGRANRETKGYVIGFSEKCNYDPEKIKEIIQIIQNHIAIEAKLVALAAWMKEHYGGTMIQALKTVLPIKQQEKQKEQRSIRLLLDRREAKERLSYFLSKNQTARARVVAALLDRPILPYEYVTRQLKVTAAVLRAMEEQRILQIEAEVVYRNPVTAKRTKQQSFCYTEAQQAAIHTFCEEYRRGKRGTYLVYGVTGSGKTEVYMEMIEHVIAEGKQAIVLIPEIALTYQTVMRFYQRFGDRVSIINSRLSKGERYDQMIRAKRGEINVMIGPRSALFTPFERLGLIIIDEEHEGTYKSEQTPRYHARETAIARAAMEGASVVLGSATPSMEAFYKAVTGEFRLLRLPERAKQRAMAHVTVADMRKELEKGNRSIFSDALRSLMEDRLKKKEQIMLFLNRRGYAGFISCRSCGHVVKCPHCDVSLSSHRNGKLVCHYCGYEQPMVTSCPECGSSHVGGFRAGTQQIEELLLREFPQAKVLRMDMDTTKQKDGHEKILAAFSSGEADILVGTQMIVKGHDFGNVTLVGVLAADLSLYADDYRAGERTFQLLTQAAGRAGRGEKAGEVVIQTYSPEHYSIVAAAKQDYEQFFQEEMTYRALMGYPPASQLMAVLVSCKEEELLETACHYLKAYAETCCKKCERAGTSVQLIGPASPYVGKVRDTYRRVIYLKSEQEAVLVFLKDQLEQYIEINSGFQNLWIQFDLNPMSVF
ncbi:replication restart helicase PriA [Faecalimonas umbilicata]|uniref:replication restart helicase PriA n=1 Tax=Faecalimonas umbilicata TaxID=1912855 RepID=UPI000E3FF13D|nr:primosomal protein N' [Faecalimonas umbilicata]RGC79561.1 primosomal protein N' [Lachnospiraceae bacterium AM25-17]RJU64609.1 primosomal protein N' [Coprococcus sp. AM27-12LB]